MLDPNTLTISPFRAGGCLPETSVEACKITHNPTGISVTCRRHDKYRENQAEALAILERQVNRINNKPLDQSK